MSNMSNTTVMKLTDSGYLAVATYILTLIPLATFGNSLVIFVFWKKKLYKRPVNWFILNLAVPDLTVALLGYPMTAVSAIQKGWIFDSGGCKAYAFICFVCSCNNIMTFAAIAYFRYAIMCKNRYIAKINPRRVYIILVCIWAYSLFFTLVPFFGWSSYILEDYDLSCSIRWYEESVADSMYVFACLIFLYIVPLSIMIYSYSKIENQATRQSDAQHQQDNNRSKFIYELERKATRVCLIMSASFLISWTPYAVMSSLIAFGIKFTSPVILLPTMFAKSSCACNPIVYCLTHDLFKSYLYQIFCRHKNRVGIEIDMRETNHTVIEQRQNENPQGNEAQQSHAMVSMFFASSEIVSLERTGQRHKAT